MPNVVEELFVRVAPTLGLVVCSRNIDTTAEHPFYLLGQGWRCAKELKAGDWLISHERIPVRVEEVREAAEVATVYNLRVADYHTYFVGCDEWGFSVWAHNACVVLTRYAVPPGWNPSARHWSVEVSTGGVAVNSHQTNDTAGMPKPTDPAAVWAQWHPQAKVEPLAAGGGVPGMTIDKQKVIQVTDAQALAAQAFVATEMAKPAYPYDIYTKSCAAYVGEVLVHAGIPVPAPPTGPLSAAKLVIALNTLVES